MKTGKKALAVLLAVVMLFTAFPLRSAAQEQTSTPTLTVESTSTRTGSTVDVQITIQNNPGILGATLALRYDDKLTLTAATAGDAFSTLSLTKPGQFASPCQFIWDGESLEDEDIIDGTILTLTFQVAADAAPGSELPVRISYVPGDLIDKDLKSVSAEITNGIVTVIDFTPGDLNDDGAINTTDIISLRRFLSGGYGVTINQTAADVNDDGKLNTLDIILIRRFIAGGYGVTLLASHGICNHSLTATPAKAPTCTDSGNIAYWYCEICGKYFSDANATSIILPEEAIVPTTGHTPIVDPAVPPTYTSTGLTEGSHCLICGEVLVAQTVVAALQPMEHSISYDIANGDPYLAMLLTNGEINNPNPDRFDDEAGLTLEEISVAGYHFLGWYDGSGNGAARVTQIPKNTNHNVQLYGHWSLIPYDVTYKLYQTPLAPISNERYLHYTVDKGLVDLPNPTINNYVFLGWYTDDGVEVTKIDIGTTGDITLNAYWTSKRNLTKAVPSLGEPIICDDSENGIIYIAYEIGTIENVPVSDAIWTINSVAGLAQQHSMTVTTSITSQHAESIARTITNATVDSGTWTLSSDWDRSTSVNEVWANEHGMTVEEANTKVRSSESTICLASTSGGTSSSSHTGGTTTVDYASQNKIAEKGNHLDVGLNGKASLTMGGSASASIPVEAVNVGVGLEGSSTLEIGGSINSGVNQGKTINKHSGTDKTTVNTTVTGSTSSWNNSSSSSTTEMASESETVSKALSEVISNTKGYGETYSYGGSGSESQGFSNSTSESMNTSTMVTYSTSEIVETTTTYSTDGKSEGSYRLVLASTAHVFAVVGYDVASKSYFTYTYSILDDKTHEFLDYSPDNNFNDYENGCLPFEVPYEVYEIVAERTAMTSGLSFSTNSATGTAAVSGYSGSDDEVFVPTYISAGGRSYKVTGILPAAFSGKAIRVIHLGNYIDEIAASAFKNCTALEDVSGYFTKIGNEAFSGCTNLENFTLSDNVSYIGTNAFEGVPSLTVNAINKDVAYRIATAANENAEEAQIIDAADSLTQQLIASALLSGADSITLDLATVNDGIKLTLEVPQMAHFELRGSGKSFVNMKISSSATTTELKEITIVGTMGIPLQIASTTLILDAVIVQSPSYVLLMTGESANIRLLRDNRLTSSVGKAVVCNNPALTAVAVDYVSGCLYASGDVYYCGTVSGTENLNFESGRLVQISAEEFAKLSKGAFSVSFDANGGTVSADLLTVYYGQPYGDLPVPTRAFFTFKGWYLDLADESTIITADTVFSSETDQILYARWEDNPPSGWVKASDVPSGAEIIDRKWTYTLTSYTTSSSSALAGWTLYKSTSEWGSWGSWSGWTSSSVSGSDSRQVETENRHTGYNMIVYNTMTTGGKRQFRSFSVNGSYGSYGLSSSYGEYCYSMWASVETIQSATAVAEGAYTSACAYPGTNKGYGTGYILNYDGTAYVFFVSSNTYTTYYRYRDRSLVYTFYFSKTEEKESATMPSGENITNVEEWVMYRAQ